MRLIINNNVSGKKKENDEVFKNKLDVKYSRSENNVQMTNAN